MSRRVILYLILLALLGLPSVAHANAYHDVLSAYQRHGAVPACQFSSHELSAAIKEEDTYDAQYFADFSNSIDAALAARASGQCGGSGGAGGAASAASAGGPGSSLPPGGGDGASASGGQRLGPLTAATGSGLPAPIVLMGLIALVAGLVAAAFGLAAAGGWDPAWAAAWRHGVGEAGYRLSAILAEFADWRRSGRRRSSA